MIPFRRRRNPARPSLRGLLAIAAMLVLAGCSVLLETPPAATPADFAGIAGYMGNHGITVEHVVSGDAGCDDATLRQTAIAFDAQGLDQATPTRVYVYIFRDRDTFERLRQTVDTCARSYVTDPSAFESVEVSPFVAGSAGPWGQQFRDAVRAALTEAAGTGD